MVNTKSLKTGRRKTSVATAELKKGSSKITVNAKTAEEYFQKNARNLSTVNAPFAAVAEKGLDAAVKVNGGGLTSQAGAVRHAISRALAATSEDYKKLLKKAGFLTRDPRMVERKKPGQPGARSRFQFSKR